MTTTTGTAPEHHGTARPRRRTGVHAALLVPVVVVALVTAAGAALLASFRNSSSRVDQLFVAIEQVPRRPPPPEQRADASTGSFVSPCRRNENAHLNSDNVITSPRRRHAAAHLHEYVGNLSTDAFSTDRSLGAAGTTCRNGDTSAYYWPVLRALIGASPAGRAHHDEDGAGGSGASGVRIPPESVLVQFSGSPASKVVAMPRFLRVVTGDPRAATAPTSGVPKAQWSCTGFHDRRSPLYPLCPPGQRVLRIFEFPSCWDGRRTDSPNHRAHVVFPAAGGACPRETFPIPQLRLEVAYPVPPGRSFAVDSFPEQRRHPATDHADFINVMPDPLMAQVVNCVNSGRHC